jgi:hypothetical protein
MAVADPSVMSILSDLFARNRNYDRICDFFKIPQERRLDSDIADQIIERINQYLTSYIGRRSIAERESGAAFKSPEPAPLPDLPVERARSDIIPDGKQS